eukprot:10203259-Lingulodinium_polyedra.AAC.1
MHACPFGAGVTAAGGRYLGAWLAAAAIGALREGQRWEQTSLALVAVNTWKKPTTTHTERAHQLVIYPSAMA